MTAARVLCDWGGTRLRASLEVDGVIVERCEGAGIGMLQGRPPTEVLLAAIAPWRRKYRIRSAVLCGMAGSRNGVAEVPYANAPVGIAAWTESRKTVGQAELALTIAAGVRARDFRRIEDVMRGEETQVFGALILHPQLSRGGHLFLLPGTHSKWVEVNAGEIIRLQTFVTGELYALLCESSSLLRASARDAEAEDGFEAGLERADHSDLAASLFETRSAQLTSGKTGGWAREFLSGLLLGAETRSMLRSSALPPGGAVTIIGEPALAALYGRALARSGVHSDRLDGETTVLAGLRRLSSIEQGAS
ncbi:MAG: 2-dehydro-3-deoxygalactonokinase [Steroidobacterales bacterium]